jgi:sporulation protein YlmC with PRC-barrel domain
MEAHMNRIATLLGISLMTALPLASAMAQQPSTPPTAAPQGQPQGQQAVLVGSDSLVGSTVRNNEGRDIGKVDRLMIDPNDGRIQNLIIATGGTLGVGANMISVPWSAVKVGQDGGKVIVTANQMLDSAPGRASAPADQQQKNDQKRKQ